jgi:hypothetical protein
LEILKRSSLLSLILVIAIGLIGFKVRRVWEGGQGGLSEPVKRKALSGVLEIGQSLGKRQLANTDAIVKKNLFHPQRGEGEPEVTGDSSLGMDKLKDLVLLGTVIAGSERYALVKIPPDNKPRARRARRLGRSRSQPRGELRRLVLGDTLEGFRLEEIHAQKVVFKKDSSTVDVVLDFSRKVKKDEIKEEVKVTKKAKKLPKAKRPRRVVRKRPRSTVAP